MVNTAHCSLFEGLAVLGEEEHDAILWWLQGFPSANAFLGNVSRGVFETTLLNFEFDVEWSELYLQFSAGHSEILSKPWFAAATDA